MLEKQQTMITRRTMDIFSKASFDVKIVKLSSSPITFTRTMVFLYASGASAYFATPWKDPESIKSTKKLLAQKVRELRQKRLQQSDGNGSEFITKELEEYFREWGHDKIQANHDKLTTLNAVQLQCVVHILFHV